MDLIVGLNIITGGISYYVNSFKFQSWTALIGKRKELITFSHFAIRNKDVVFVLVVVCQISFPSPLILLVCSVQLALRIPLPPLVIQLPFHGAPLQHWHHWHLIAGLHVSILRRDQQPHLKLWTISLIPRSLRSLFSKRAHYSFKFTIPGIIRDMYIGEFCSFPPITLNPSPSSVLGSSTTRGWAWPSLAAKAATVAYSNLKIMYSFIIKMRL